MGKKEEPTNELIAVNYGVQEETGKAFVRLQVNGVDQYLLTIHQAREIGMHMIEAAGMATYEQACWQHTTASIDNTGAKGIIQAFRNRIKRIKIGWQ